MKHLCFFLFALFSITINLHSFSGEGRGTNADPYQITNVEQLQEMNKDHEANYIMMNDIDATVTKNWNNGAGFIPIGLLPDNYGDINKYTLDGKGYIIKNLYIDTSAQYITGLFAIIGKYSKILNLGIEDSKANGIVLVGGLCGKNFGTIENCFFKGKVSGRGPVGGLCGRNIGGRIIKSFFEGSVDGSDNIGGLCGKIENGIIEKCHSIGDISGKNSTGGFCSDISFDSKVDSCFFEGTVTGGEPVGGFCGNNMGSITNSNSIAEVTGESGTGGFIGFNWAFDGVTNCYSKGIVEGESNTGGFCGFLFLGVINNCYSEVNVSGKDEVGGFCGYNESRIINSYSKGVIRGNNDVGGFVGYWNHMTIENCFFMGSVKGNENIGGFIGFSNTSSVKRCYSISDVEGNDNVGGFAGKSSYAYIEECYSEGNVKGNGRYIGGLCGDLWLSSIKNSYSIASVNGGSRTAGFCGPNSSTNIRNCYSAGSVSGDGDVAGFTFFNQLKTNCFWDIQTSGTEDGQGGTGLPTTEMMKRSSFENAGWDFDTTWCIGEGKTYPQLQWFVDCTTLSVDETVYSSDKLNIYPNPTDGKFTISLDTDYPIESINIYNIYGQLVGEYSSSSNEITLNPNLPQGIYYIEAIAGRKKYTGKIVVGR